MYFYIRLRNSLCCLIASIIYVFMYFYIRRYDVTPSKKAKFSFMYLCISILDLEPIMMEQ